MYDGDSITINDKVSIKYNSKNPIRLPVPGHKGKNFLGYEKYDLTEIDGADELYLPTGIIKESQENASEIFGFPTYYTVEGSSHAIRAILYLTKIFTNYFYYFSCWLVNILITIIARFMCLAIR